MESLLSMDTLFKSMRSFLCTTPFCCGSRAYDPPPAPRFFVESLTNGGEWDTIGINENFFVGFLSRRETVCPVSASLWVKVLSTGREEGICPDIYPIMGLMRLFCAI